MQRLFDNDVTCLDLKSTQTFTKWCEAPAEVNIVKIVGKSSSFPVKTANFPCKIPLFTVNSFQKQRKILSTSTLERSSIILRFFTLQDTRDREILFIITGFHSRQVHCGQFSLYIRFYKIYLCCQIVHSDLVSVPHSGTSIQAGREALCSDETNPRH